MMPLDAFLFSDLVFTVIKSAIFWPSQFNISTPDRLWDAILKVWNINNDSGVSERRIKEDILNWVESIDKIIEAKGAYVDVHKKKLRRGQRGDLEKVAKLEEQIRRRFILDLNANPIEFVNGIEVGSDDEENGEIFENMNDDLEDLGN
eukprot:g1197.t1